MIARITHAIDNGASRCGEEGKGVVQATPFLIITWNKIGILLGTMEH